MRLREIGSTQNSKHMMLSEDKGEGIGGAGGGKKPWTRRYEHRTDTSELLR